MLSDSKTGYPSIDKPWLKYYKNDAPNMPSPDMSIFDFLYRNNTGSLDCVALNYFGNRITYRKLFDNIEAVAASLQAIGVKNGDIVTLCALNTPEFIYLLYALNKIGAVSNWIGITSPETDLHEQLLQTKSRIVFTVDIAFEKIKKASVDTNVGRIITVPIYQSMPALIKMIVKLKSKKGSTLNKYNWSSFLKESGDRFDVIDIAGEDIAVIEYTGGSTGKPKGVMLSNKALNSYYVNLSTANSNGIFNYEKSDRYLSGVPFFLAFGLNVCCHSPLSHSMELVLAPDPNPDAGTDLILNAKVQHVVGGRLLVEGMLDKAHKKQSNLSYVKSVVYGGEEANTTWERKVINELNKNNAAALLINGYGMTETSAATLVEINNDTAEFIPLANIKIMIADPEDSTHELGYDTEGELCISSDTLMAGYYNNDYETQEVLFEKDNTRWLKTRDLATVSADGLVKITGRIKRIYSRIDSDGIQSRVYPMRIEEALAEHGLVKQSAVIGIKYDLLAYKSVAYIIPSIEGIDENDAKRRLQIHCHEKLPDSHQPDEYVFVERLPITRAGKVDYRDLERMAQDRLQSVGRTGII